MSRKSARLVAAGYYHSDEDSDSSTVTNISYRESPVRVFKKKKKRSRSPKPASRTSSRANSVASSANTELPGATDQCDHDGLSPLQSSSTQHTVTAGPSITADPRPALTRTSSRSRTPATCPSVGQEMSSLRPDLQHRLHHRDVSGRGVESSGYSSCEGRHAATTTTSRTSISSRTGHSSGSSFRKLVSLVISVVRSRIKWLTVSANTSSSSRMKKASVLFLLLLLFLLIIILSIWFLLPFLTSLVTIMKTGSESKRGAVQPSPVLDPAVVSAVVEEKMQHLLKELLLKQESVLHKVEQRLQQDMQDMRTRLRAVDSDGQLRLQKEVAGLSKQMTDYQSEFHSETSSFTQKIQELEAQNAKLARELSSMQLKPPPAPCPDPGPASVHDQLTPQLQQAMEKWLTDRVTERDLIRGSRSDCGRPVADMMADFALETQGASVVSTRCSETYRIRSACVTLFGFPLWYPSESPRTVIQGHPVLLPGKCWAFHGVQGTLVISLSHPIMVTHVTLDHLPRYNAPTGRIDSAPKDFEVYGMINDTEKGSLLGNFTYNQDGEPTQTFKLPDPSEVVYRFVELRILSNWGHVEYTCVYRFRVHGKIAT